MNMCGQHAFLSQCFKFLELLLIRGGCVFFATARLHHKASALSPLPEGEGYGEGLQCVCATSNSPPSPLPWTVKLTCEAFPFPWRIWQLLLDNDESLFARICYPTDAIRQPLICFPLDCKSPCVFRLPVVRILTRMPVPQLLPYIRAVLSSFGWPPRCARIGDILPRLLLIESVHGN